MSSTKTKKKLAKIVVRQDTLDALQRDGSWGCRSTARKFWKKDAAFDAANEASEKIGGRMVTVQDEI